MRIDQVHYIAVEASNVTTRLIALKGEAATDDDDQLATAIAIGLSGVIAQLSFVVELCASLAPLADPPDPA